LIFSCLGTTQRNNSNRRSAIEDTALTSVLCLWPQLANSAVEVGLGSGFVEENGRNPLSPSEVKLHKVFEFSHQPTYCCLALAELSHEASGLQLGVAVVSHFVFVGGPVPLDLHGQPAVLLDLLALIAPDYVHHIVDDLVER
jgi:hypothetical protein